MSIFDDFLEEPKGKDTKESEDEKTKKSKEPKEPEEPKEPDKDEDSDETQDPDEAYRKTLLGMARSMLGGEDRDEVGDDEDLEEPGEPDEDVDIDINPNDYVVDGEFDYAKYARDVKKASLDAVKRAIKDVQNMVVKHTKSIESKLSASTMLDKFLIKNPELEDYRDYVTVKWNLIVKENPKISYAELFKRLGREVRNDLRLPAKGRSRDNEHTGLPPETNSSRRGTGSKSKLQQMLDEHYRGR